MSKNESTSENASGDFFDDWVAPWIAPVVIGGGVAVGIFGWETILWLLAWFIIVLASLGALVFGLVALDSKQADERTESWIVAGVCAAIAFVAFWFGGTRSADKPQAVDSPQTADIGLVATMKYWNAVPKCFDGESNQIESPNDLIRVFRETAVRIEQLPTKDVDPLAVEWGLAAADSLRQVAAVTASNTSEHNRLVVRSFFHGFSGDLAGGVHDMARTIGNTDNRTKAAILHFEQVWDQQRAQVRAKLTSKYSVQFP